MSDKSLLGADSIAVEQLKFTADEIKQALARENDEYCIEVSYSPSVIKIYPKDPNSLDDPITVTVERPKFVNNLNVKLWHMELHPAVTVKGTDPRTNHARFANIPFDVFLDQLFSLLDNKPYLWSAGKKSEATR